MHERVEVPASPVATRVNVCAAGNDAGVNVKAPPVMVATVGVPEEHEMLRFASGAAATLTGTAIELPVAAEPKTFASVIAAEARLYVTTALCDAP